MNNQQPPRINPASIIPYSRAELTPSPNFDIILAHLAMYSKLSNEATKPQYQELLVQAFEAMYETYDRSTDQSTAADARVTAYKAYISKFFSLENTLNTKKSTFHVTLNFQARIKQITGKTTCQLPQTLVDQIELVLVSKTMPSLAEFKLAPAVGGKKLNYSRFQLLSHIKSLLTKEQKESVYYLCAQLFGFPLFELSDEQIHELEVDFALAQSKMLAALRYTVRSSNPSTYVRLYWHLTRAEVECCIDDFNCPVHSKALQENLDVFEILSSMLKS